MSTSRPAVGALVLLDANILYPIRLCDFFLTAGTVGLIAKPVVSEEILAEAQRNVTADRADLGEDRIKRRFDAVRTATSGGDDSIPKRYFDTAIINEKDRHVLAAVRYPWRGQAALARRDLAGVDLRASTSSLVEDDPQPGFTHQTGRARFCRTAVSFGGADGPYAAL